MNPLLDNLEHSCPWKDEALALRPQLLQAQQQLAAALAQIQLLERRLLGPKSEKIKSVEKELDAEPSKDPEKDKQKALQRRRDRQQQRQKLVTQRIVHSVPREQQRCPHCGNTELGEVGPGKQTVMYEYVPGYFVRQEHVQQTLSCRCGQYIVTAPVPPKPIDKGLYGPGVVAHAVVGKCADSLPLYRQAKGYQRRGIPMARSTLGDLFHGAAQRLLPLSQRLLQLIAAADVVQADETPLKMQTPNKRGYVWTFLHDELIGYRFSGDRSGQTPQQVLGGTPGTLVVDAYTGYNHVTGVSGRQRSGCLAHARRKFFEAQSSSPAEAKQALALILEVYRVEHVAKQRRIVRTPEHLHLTGFKNK
jgi:transposase